MANLITCFRIFCALALGFCPVFSKPFYAFYLLGGISDVLDGIAARHFGKETKLGARLDTIADAVFITVALIKLLCAAVLPTWAIVWTALIAGIKCCNVICGFVIYKRFLAEHTRMNKLCGVLVFAIPLYIGSFSQTATAVLIALTCAAATFAAVQEGHFIRTGREIA